MNTDHFDWEMIFKDAARILSESLSEPHNNITKASELYQKLKLEYEKLSNPVPTQNTFTKKLHTYLHMDNHQRIYKTSIYQLIGVYYPQSIKPMAQNFKIISAVPDNMTYLFLQLDDKNNKTADNLKILYEMVYKLKSKFINDILFISYDSTTIVIICKNQSSREKIQTFIDIYQKK